MSDLENRNRDVLGALIQDLSIPLDREAQSAAAIWAMKTVMVFECVTGEADRFYTTEERYALRESSLIPGGTVMWVGRCGEAHVMIRSPAGSWEGTEKVSRLH